MRSSFGVLSRYSSFDVPLSAEFFVRLLEPEFRCETGLFLAEGARFAYSALDSGSEIAAVGYCPSLFRRHQHPDLWDRLCRVPRVEVPSEVFARIAFSPEPQGLFLAIRQRRLTLDQMVSRSRSTWLAVERIRSGGNLGTILRSLHASGGSGLVVFGCPPLDVFAPDVVRASMGSILHVPVVYTTHAQFKRWDLRCEFRVFGASAEAQLSYRRTNLGRKSILMVGDERDGLTQGQRSNCDSLISIPMAPKVDSLNVAMSASVLLFEAQHQRDHR